jgi:protein SCO1
MAKTKIGRTGDGETERALDGGFWLVVGLAVICAVLILLSIVRTMSAPGVGVASASPGAGTESASPSPSTSSAWSSYLVEPVRPAPRLALTSQDAQPFSLSHLRGSPAFVFFGYSHCPDVCPATIGTIGLAMEAVGEAPRAVFVTIDPARDTVAWLAEYVRFLPAGFVGLTGTDAEIGTAAAAWGVQYAKVETGATADYAMSHTADVFLVDAAGNLRARFPFGTEAAAMAETYRAVVASPVAAASAESSASTPVTTASPASALEVTVVSSSVWAGTAGPVILTLAQDGERIDDPDLRPTVQLTTPDGDPVGAPVTAVAVRPPGVTTVSYVATLPIPDPGAWRLTISVDLAGSPATGAVAISALDQGETARIGEPAPTAHTPTLADVGGVARAVTTDPAPDLRLSQRSTTDALADGQPFVLVIDSTKFRVSPACGRAIIMARYLLDRWPTVGFIHLEPYVYDVVTDTPLLRGSLDDPTLTDPANAWGIGGAPWGARSMPWVFVVDGQGIVRAAYQGVVGSDEVDVIVSLIEQGG